MRRTHLARSELDDLVEQLVRLVDPPLLDGSTEAIGEHGMPA
jgi:hypothetical protein